MSSFFIKVRSGPFVYGLLPSLDVPLVPINPATVSRAHELQHMLSFLEVGALVVHDDSIATQLSVNALLKVQGIGIRLVASGCGVTDWEPLGDFLRMPDAPGTKVEDQDIEDTALVLSPAALPP